MSGITPRQREALAFIEGYVDRNGYSPNYDEIKDALGLKARSAVNRLVCQLVERGRVTAIPHRARSIQIVSRAA